jgi:DNA-binding transcriptional MerR regulator
VQGDLCDNLRMMTIANFAARTGIAASALRFYEEEGLLVPAGRLPNGYRLYDPAQVPVALLIQSLREAGVGLVGIRAFLQAGTAERESLLALWRQEMAAKLLSLQMADQYLGGLEPEAPQIHLLRWAEPSWLLWLPARAPAAPLPFGPALKAGERLLREQSISFSSSGYVRTIDLVAGELVGEVGFQLRTRPPRWPEGARLEQISPTLFAMLECNLVDETSAHRVYRYLARFGFAPSGLYLERYLPGERERYQIMLAIRPAR